MAAHDAPPAGAAASTGSHLGRLNDLDDFKVADGYPDIRGWDVRTTDGRHVGKVGDLVVDTAAMRVRYLDVEVDRSVGQAARDAATPGEQERHTLLPIGNVQLDGKGDHVLVDGYTLEQIAGLPRYGGRAITRDYEDTLRRGQTERSALAAAASASALPAAAAAPMPTPPVAGSERVATEPATAYDHPDYDDQRLYAPRRMVGGEASRGDVARGETARGETARPEATRGESMRGEPKRLTLSEEQLNVGKRQVSAGEAEIRKAVDVRHVQQQVDVTREEISVERRPIAEGAELQPIGEDEISIPVMEERLVVEKRLVPVEQIIVRKRRVTEQQTVDADLRRERLEVDDASARSAGLVRDAGTGAATGGTRGTTDR